MDINKHRKLITINRVQKMSSRYYSTSGRRAFSIRLILMIIIPLLVLMFSWLYFSRDQDSVGLVNDQSTVQALNIPNQEGSENQQLAGVANTLKGLGEENNLAKQESEIEIEEQGSESNLDQVQPQPQLQAQQATTPLPPLSDSDTVFRQDLLNLSSGFSPWLNSKNILKQWLLVANDFSQNLRPHKHFSQFKVSQPFLVASDNAGMYITEQSYQRYNKLASAVHAVNIESALDLYNKYRPLLQQVFAEFAYPEEYQVEDIIKKATSSILQAPILVDKVRVVKPSVYYKFAEKKLEMLSPVQKQMIRMGPENTRIIQAKLRQFIEALANR